MEERVIRRENRRGGKSHLKREWTRRKESFEERMNVEEKVIIEKRLCCFQRPMRGFFYSFFFDFDPV